MALYIYHDIMSSVFTVSLCMYLKTPKKSVRAKLTSLLKFRECITVHDVFPSQKNIKKREWQDTFSSLLLSSPTVQLVQ
jgi:hypothetical protein